MDIRQGLLDHPQVLDLLRIHLSGMHENTPAGHVYALDVSKLKTPDIVFLTAWDHDVLMGCGALKDLGDGTAEIKSMRTHPDHLRKGVGAAILSRIIQTARERGYKRLSLETGNDPSFDPALTLYRKVGFENGQAFSDYAASEYNQFLHLDV